MSVCKWCGRRPAIPEDYDKAEAGGSDDGVCWREWNDYSDCHEIEQGLIDLATLMRNTILAWEAWEKHRWEYCNASIENRIELDPRIECKANDFRRQVLDALKDLPGGGGAVEKPRITPLPAAAGPSTAFLAEVQEYCDEYNERQKLRFDIGTSNLGIPIKGQDGSPCDKTEIVSGIMDGFAQPLPNLDHLVDRKPRMFPMTAEQMDEFVANAIPATSIDDDLDDVPLGKACSLDDPGCESCQ